MFWKKKEKVIWALGDKGIYDKELAEGKTPKMLGPRKSANEKDDHFVNDQKVKSMKLYMGAVVFETREDAQTYLTKFEKELKEAGKNLEIYPLFGDWEEDTAPTIDQWELVNNNRHINKDLYFRMDKIKLGVT